MVPPFPNVDFANLHLSVTNLERALEDADRQKTAPKGARALAAHQPVEELRQIAAEDLSNVLNSPLRPARGSGYGCLPLEAVQPMRQLHEMLLRAVGPKGNPDILNDSAMAADLHRRVQDLVASIDPDHPFLKVEFEFKGSQRDDGDDEEQQQQQQTPGAKGKGKQVVGTPQGKIVARIEEFRVPLANKILAMSSTCGDSSRQTGPERLGRRPSQRRRRSFFPIRDQIAKAKAEAKLKVKTWAASRSTERKAKALSELVTNQREPQK